jgi:hypothetical protein
MPTKIIDDEDLSQVTYTGDWVHGGTADGYGGTVVSSTKVDDYFTVAFEGMIHFLQA